MSRLLIKNDNSTSSKQAIGHNQKCVTTYTKTNKENYTETAADLPMPAGGQASRLLEERFQALMGSTDFQHVPGDCKDQPSLSRA